LVAAAGVPCGSSDVGMPVKIYGLVSHGVPDVRLQINETPPTENSYIAIPFKKHTKVYNTQRK
jgi:hypothetical protein